MKRHLLTSSITILITQFCSFQAFAQQYCTDSSTYTFGSFLYNGSQVTRNCAWITKHNSDIRRKRWCDERVNGLKVSEACPVACDTCPYPTSSPTKSPTHTPTISVPTDYCMDSRTYTFGSFLYNGSEVLESFYSKPTVKDSKVSKNAK